MNLNDFLSAIRQRYSPDKVTRRTPAHRGGNVTPVGLRDPGVYNHAEEQQTRDMMTRQYAYAERGPSFDPSGKYLCHDCKHRIEIDLDKYNALCNAVDGVISLSTGSCDKFTYGDYAADDKLLMNDQEMMHGAGLATKEDAGYQERPISKAFGCLRCVHATRAKSIDSDTRRLWCRRFGVHVAAVACCAAHLGHDSVTQFEE